MVLPIQANDEIFAPHSSPSDKCPVLHANRFLLPSEMPAG